MKKLVLTLCAACTMVVAAYGEALAEKWQATTTVSCPSCKVPELDRKLYQAVEDAAFRKNQPVTFMSGNAKQLTYRLAVTAEGNDFTSKAECQDATSLFEAGVQEVFGEYNSSAKLKFKRKCARGK